jgi:hypothetical protein
MECTSTTFHDGILLGIHLAMAVVRNLKSSASIEKKDIVGLDVPV